MLSTEDAAFHRHAGFDAEAIRNSVRENLRARKFVRGASTISMQLAKNLYLGRGKTVSRKLQEAFLTAYLEQELTKRQLLELYFNVVELGPAVYGVRAGAEHQFHTSPSRLSVSQAFYLMSILPKPSAVHAGAGGAVTPGYVSHLRRLMKNAHRRKLLADDELDLGLRETPVVGSPATELAEPSADTVAPSDSPPEEPPP